MTVTPRTLTRGAAVAAVAAGVLFVGVQLGHPHLDVESVTTTEVMVRSLLKALMAALALAGITGLYLRQVREAGIVGLVGYLLLGAGYLLIAFTSLLAALVLPTVAGAAPGYVSDVLAVSTSAGPGDIGPLATALLVQGILYLAGGIVFGVALVRARVLPRWTGALLAASGLASLALPVMPDALYRLLAYPNGIAMIALGFFLWRSVRTAAAPAIPAVARAGAA